MSKALISGCGSAATFIGGFAMPIAFPAAPKWVGQTGLVIAGLLLLLTIVLWLFENRKPADTPDASSSSPASQWVPLDDAIRYLADYPVPQAQMLFDPHLPIRIGLALRDALLCGDLDARGRRYDTLRGGIKDPPLHSLKPIPPEDWDGAHIESYYVLQGQFRQVAAGRHSSVIETSDNKGYHDIRVRRDQLQKLWPRKGALRNAR
ncbi:hypothetical protein AAG604_05735 [Citromicrobium bathyomarinum]